MMANALTVESIRKSTETIMLLASANVDPETHRSISTGKKESRFSMDIVLGERAVKAGVATVSGPELIAKARELQLRSGMPLTI